MVINEKILKAVNWQLAIIQDYQNEKESLEYAECNLEENDILDIFSQIINIAYENFLQDQNYEKFDFFIKKQYNIFKLEEYFGNVEDILIIIKYIIKDLTLHPVANNLYNIQRLAENMEEPIKSAIYYCLLKYALNNELIFKNTEIIIKINEYLKENNNLTQNNYMNTLNGIFSKLLMRQKEIND